MADRQSTSQVNLEVATLNTGSQAASQVNLEVAAITVGNQAVSQENLEVAALLVGRQKVSCLRSETAVTLIGKQKVSQCCMEVAFTNEGIAVLDLMEYTTNALAQAAYIVDEDTAGSVTIATDTTVVAQGAYSLQISTSTDALNATITKTLATSVDLSGYATVSFWMYSSRTGSNLIVGIHDFDGVTTEVTPDIITANTWQLIEMDLTFLEDTAKDVIDQIIITVTNADEAGIYYFDKLVGVELLPTAAICNYYNNSLRF